MNMYVHSIGFDNYKGSWPLLGTNIGSIVVITLLNKKPTLTLSHKLQ